MPYRYPAWVGNASKCISSQSSIANIKWIVWCVQLQARATQHHKTNFSERKRKLPWLLIVESCSTPSFLLPALSVCSPDQVSLASSSHAVMTLFIMQQLKLEKLHNRWTLTIAADTLLWNMPFLLQFIEPNIFPTEFGIYSIISQSKYLCVNIV